MVRPYREPAAFELISMYQVPGIPFGFPAHATTYYTWHNITRASLASRFFFRPTMCRQCEASTSNQSTKTSLLTTRELKKKQEKKKVEREVETLEKQENRSYDMHAKSIFFCPFCTHFRLAIALIYMCTVSFRRAIPCMVG